MGNSKVLRKVAGTQKNLHREESVTSGNYSQAGFDIHNTTLFHSFIFLTGLETYRGSEPPPQNREYISTGDLESNHKCANVVSFHYKK